MTRRRILYRPDSGVGFWITPEINGDRDEFLRIGSADVCDLTWDEMKNLFCGIQCYEDFERAAYAMQRCYHSSISQSPAIPPRYILSLDDVCCDELYEAAQGQVKRIYGTNLIHVQIYYREQESSDLDTVQFDCPPGKTQAEVLDAIRSAQREMPIGEDEDRISWMDDVLSRAALSLHSTWEYVPIAGVIEVE